MARHLSEDEGVWECQGLPQKSTPTDFTAGHVLSPDLNDRMIVVEIKRRMTFIKPLICSDTVLGIPSISFRIIVVLHYTGKKRCREVNLLSQGHRVSGGAKCKSRGSAPEPVCALNGPTTLPWEDAF